MANTKSIDLELDSTQYGYKTDTASLSITGDMSVEAWIKLETKGIDQCIVGKYYTTDNLRCWRLSINTSNVIDFVVSSDGSGATSCSGTTALTTGIWYHIAAAYDASEGDAWVYLNAVQDGSNTTTMPTSIYDGNNRTAVGAVNTEGTPVQLYDGLIDEVRIWNDIRTPAEISANYKKELVGDEAGLVAYWKFNDNSNDTTANANNLTLSGSPVYSADIPDWPPLAGGAFLLQMI